ncbi:zinc dependent phospholipase C family protein [Candidatus Bathyarchaeota archaeon]|nr:zinc dependent phospholipase C family protein [Candidatus Bathyarchaeota archaeon]
MWKRKTVSTLTVGLLLACFLVGSARVSGWSNGGYSADPNNPDYGTHDWIAEHALDWLPLEEKQFLLDNKAVYLYGTELPDNGQAADGIGDTTKHHIYYLVDCSVQDDVAGDRAEEAYVKAVAAYNAGNFSEAAKQLGIVTHYIADMAVFGHVMGAATAWGAETHHSDYEDYVQTRTNSYVDDFDSFLVFDGSLSTLSAYDAALMLANDTTFDADGQLTCVWMDQHYDWSDAAFRNRSGESLNLAVNAVADVLHTFSVDATVIPEFPTWIVLPLFLFAALFAVALKKRSCSVLKAF